MTTLKNLSLEVALKKFLETYQIDHHEMPWLGKK